MHLQQNNLIILTLETAIIFLLNIYYILLCIYNVMQYIYNNIFINCIINIDKKKRGEVEYFKGSEGELK